MKLKFISLWWEKKIQSRKLYTKNNVEMIKQQYETRKMIENQQQV